jgi:hypothetical protein
MPAFSTADSQRPAQTDMAKVPPQWTIALARAADLHERLPMTQAQSLSPAPSIPKYRAAPPLSSGDIHQGPETSLPMAGALPLPSPLDMPTAPDSTQGLRIDPAAAPAPADAQPARSGALEGRTVPPVPQQIADAIRQSNGGQIELTLSPDELGRVTLSFQPEGDGVRVHLVTERPETLDLLRRHIPELAAELRAAGYDTASFSFGRQGQAPRDAQDTGHRGAQDAGPAEPVLPRPSHAASGTLDLRL